jgi:hypothetical protein
MHEAAQFATAPTHANTSHCCVIDWVWYARMLPRITGAACTGNLMDFSFAGFHLNGQNSGYSGLSTGRCSAGRLPHMYLRMEGKCPRSSDPGHNNRIERLLRFCGALISSPARRVLLGPEVSWLSPLCCWFPAGPGAQFCASSGTHMAASPRPAASKIDGRNHYTYVLTAQERTSPTVTGSTSLTSTV